MKQKNRQESNLPIELAAPAQRALAGAGIYRLEQIVKFSETEIAQLHGIGPNALNQLRRALAASNLWLAINDKAAEGVSHEKSRCLDVRDCG